MYPRRTTIWLCVSVAVLFFGIPVVALAQQDGYWSAGRGGSWADTANWDSGLIAQGTDNTAYFGIGIEPAIPANATFTLDGSQTIGNLEFTGTTGPDNWVFNTGSGGPLILDDDFELPGITTYLANQQITMNLVLAGDAGLEKQGDGTLILNVTNTYTGGTLVSGGTLIVNGQITDTNALTVANGTLGGTGTISGPVTVQTGCLFAPGNPLGTMTISNSLLLQSGSTTRISVNASTSAHDTIQGISAANYGGTLVVSNLAGTPTLGQQFSVFSATSPGGDFAGISPQLAGPIRWRFDPATGLLSVVSTNSQPGFSGIARWGSAFVLSVTNGVPGATNYVLASTNLALPLANWPPLATNIYDAGGNLIFTNTTGNGLPRRFYVISSKP